MDYPRYVRIGEKKYAINTDFRVAIECNEIALDNSINDLERALAIIYKLYGEEGLKDWENHNKLLELALKYLSCNKENVENNNDPDMDYVEDTEYIKSSFKYDYKYNPYDMEYLHWYEFFNDLNNLSNSEFGNCCILNRIRSARRYDASKIEDRKEREEFIKYQKSIALKKYQKKNNLTKEQEKSRNAFLKDAGIVR